MFWQPTCVLRCSKQPSFAGLAYTACIKELARRGVKSMGQPLPIDEHMDGNGSAILGRIAGIPDLES